MGVHGIVAGGRGVTGFLAGGEKVHKFRSRSFRYAAGKERCADVFLRLLGHVHGQLVPNEAHQRAVQLLIEGRVQVFLQEFTGGGKPLERHAGGLAVARSGYVGPAGGGLAEAQPAACAGKQKR